MIVLTCLNLLIEAGFLQVSPICWLLWDQFLASLFLQYEEEKVMKSMDLTSTRKDRLPEIFKMHARFLICSLYHLFQAQLASWKRMEKFDRHYSSRIFIKRAWVWVQFPRKIIHNKWKSITQCHFRFIGNASRCIHTSCVIPFTVTPYKSA